jgi:hypothetical protein
MVCNHPAVMLAVDTPIEQDIERLVERLAREENEELVFLAREAMIMLSLVDRVRPGLVDTILDEWESNAGTR